MRTNQPKPKDAGSHLSLPAFSIAFVLVLVLVLVLSASPAGRTKIAHRFIGGCERRGVASPARDERTLPSLTGLVPHPPPLPTDESVGYFLSPCRAGPERGGTPALAGSGRQYQDAPLRAPSRRLLLRKEPPYPI